MNKRKVLIIVIACFLILASLLGILIYLHNLKKTSKLIEPGSAVGSQKTQPQFIYTIDGEKDSKKNLELVLSPKGFNHPMAVTTSPDGRVFIADTGNRRIVEFGPNGDFIKSFGTSQLEYPSSLLYGNSKLYVVDSNIMKIAVYNDQGEELPPLINKMFLKKGWSKEEEAKSIVRPTAIQMGPDGYFYITDIGNQRIIVLNAAGELIRSFGTKGAENGNFQYPGGIAVIKNGNIYVADSNNGRIQIFNSSGRFLNKIDGSLGRYGHLVLPRGLAVLSDGTIIVADVFLHRVRAFNSTGQELWSIGGMGKQEGQLYFPNNICLDLKGRIYVADRENNRIQVYSI